MKNLLSTLNYLFEKHLHTKLHINEVLFSTNNKRENSILIRQQMDIYLKQTFGGNDESILDMDNTPQGLFVKDTELYASISHTENWGLYALCDHPVGVDLEQENRISLAVVQRISTPAEITLTAYPQQIWSIKESAFKAIPFIIQPSVISDIIIEKITVVEAPIDIRAAKFICSVKEQADIKLSGMIISNNIFQLAVAIILKQ